MQIGYVYEQNQGIGGWQIFTFHSWRWVTRGKLEKTVVLCSSFDLPSTLLLNYHRLSYVYNYTLCKLSKKECCRTFDIERYYVLVIQTEFYIHPYFVVFVNVKQGQLIMHRTLKARDWYGLMFWWASTWSLFEPFCGRFCLVCFRFSGRLSTKSTPTKSFQRWWAVLQRVVVRPETSVEFEALKPHQQMSWKCTIDFAIDRLWVCCSIPNSWHSQILDVIMWWHMYFAFICFFCRNQFWWRHMKNHMWNI